MDGADERGVAFGLAQVIARVAELLVERVESFGDHRFLSGLLSLGQLPLRLGVDRGPLGVGVVSEGLISRRARFPLCRWLGFLGLWRLGCGQRAEARY